MRHGQRRRRSRYTLVPRFPRRRRARSRHPLVRNHRRRRIGRAPARCRPRTPAAGEVVFQGGAFAAGKLLAEEVHLVSFVASFGCPAIVAGSWSQPGRSSIAAGGSTVRPWSCGCSARCSPSTGHGRSTFDRSSVACWLPWWSAGRRWCAMRRWPRPSGVRGSPRSAKHALQAHVRRVRESVGDGIISTAIGGYRLGSGVIVDVDAFEAAIDAATSTSEADACGPLGGSPVLVAWHPVRGDRGVGAGRERACPAGRVVASPAEEELCAAALATRRAPLSSLRPNGWRTWSRCASEGGPW